jgi:hypothetical protein
MFYKNYFLAKESKYGVQIYSTDYHKLGVNSLGLYPKSDYFISLVNNTSGNVIAKVFIDDEEYGIFEVTQHSSYKLLDYNGRNQFFKFRPEYLTQDNVPFTQIRIEWSPVITEYTYTPNAFSKLNNIGASEDFKYFGQTMMAYDKRINYGCSRKDEDIPDNVFTDDLSLGISSDRYRITKQYMQGKPCVQKINLISIIPNFPLVNVKDYFVYNEKQMDAYDKQFLDKIA